MQHSHQAHAAPAAAEGEGGEGGGAAAKDDAVLPSCIGVPLPPDKGCTCYVLATAFSSSQGELMRMIEFSTAKVRRPRSCAHLPLAPPFALASRAHTCPSRLPSRSPLADRPLISSDLV